MTTTVEQHFRYIQDTISNACHRANRGDFDGAALVTRFAIDTLGLRWRNYACVYTPPMHLMSRKAYYRECLRFSKSRRR